ncbi:hypothetical protein M5D96_005629, partial [Drosophila gunungcola]
GLLHCPSTRRVCALRFPVSSIRTRRCVPNYIHDIHRGQQKCVGSQINTQENVCPPTSDPRKFPPPQWLLCLCSQNVFRVGERRSGGLHRNALERKAKFALKNRRP